MTVDLFNITRYETFGDPVDAKMSEFHGLILVLGNHSLYTYNNTTGEKQTVHGTDTHEFTGFDVSDDGEVVLLMKSMSGQDHMAKIIGPDFFSILAEVDTTGQVPSVAAFSSKGSAAITADSGDGSCSGGRSTTFWDVNFSTGVWRHEGKCVKGMMLAMKYDESSGGTFSISSGGEVWLIPATTDQVVSPEPQVQRQAADAPGSSSSESSASSESSGVAFGVAKVMDLGFQVTSAVGGSLGVAVQSQAVQEKVRVFVGSRPWQNDRWDSGEVATAATTLPYGGGDNLEPGQKYWVHVMTYHTGLGWSYPQIKEFVMPKE